MASLLYYVPGHGDSITTEQIAESGIAYAFGPKCAKELHGCQRGPDNGKGVTVVRAGSMKPHLIGYKPKEQTWRKIPGSDVWVGFYNDPELRPTPQDLARDKQLDGHLVTLEDGNEWLCPVARALSENDGTLAGRCALPTMIGITDDGKWILDNVVEQYAELMNVATDFQDALVAQNQTIEDVEDGTISVKFSGEDEIDAAIVALSTNYHISKIEAVVLGLFTQRAVSGILFALIDWPTWLDWEKKNQGADDSCT